MAPLAKQVSRLTATAIWLLIVFGSACAEDEQRSHITLRLDTDLPGIEIRVSFENRTVVFSADDFSERGIADEFEVPNSGPIEFEVQFMEGGILAAQGRFGFLLRESTGWGVRFFRQVDDPLPLCLGCEGSEAFLIEPAVAQAPGEAIWVTWAGLPEGAVF